MRVRKYLLFYFVINKEKGTDQHHTVCMFNKKGGAICMRVGCCIGYLQCAGRLTTVPVFLWNHIHLLLKVKYHNVVFYRITICIFTGDIVNSD